MKFNPVAQGLRSSAFCSHIAFARFRKILTINISNYQTQCVYCEVRNGLTWASCLGRSLDSFSRRWPGFEPGPKQVRSIVDKYAFEDCDYSFPLSKSSSQKDKRVKPWDLSTKVMLFRRPRNFHCSCVGRKLTRGGACLDPQGCESSAHASATFSGPIGFHRQLGGNRILPVCGCVRASTHHFTCSKIWQISINISVTVHHIYK